MTVYTVRLNQDAERVLHIIQQETGLTITDVFKKGLWLMQQNLPKQKQTPYQIYQELDLSIGNSAAPQARNAKKVIGAFIKRKYERAAK